MNARGVLQLLSLLIVRLVAVTSAEARNHADLLLGMPNGLAQTPTMGWNSWKKFACNVNETDVRSAADAIVSTVMRDLWRHKDLGSSERTSALVGGHAVVMLTVSP